MQGFPELCSSLVHVAEETVSSVVSGVLQGVETLSHFNVFTALGKERLGAGHFPQLSLSPCGYTINSEKKLLALEEILIFTPLQMW